MKELQWLLKNGWVVQEVSYKISPPSFMFEVGVRYSELKMFKVGLRDELVLTLKDLTDQQVVELSRVVNHSLPS